MRPRRPPARGTSSRRGRAAASEALKGAEDALGAEFDGVRRNALVRGMDELHEREVRRQLHRQEAVRLDPEPGEEAGIRHAGLHERDRNTLGIEVAEGVCERLEEPEV